MFHFPEHLSLFVVVFVFALFIPFCIWLLCDCCKTYGTIFMFVYYSGPCLTNKRACALCSSKLVASINLILDFGHLYLAHSILLVLLWAHFYSNVNFDCVNCLILTGLWAHFISAEETEARMISWENRIISTDGKKRAIVVYALSRASYKMRLVAPVKLTNYA